MIRNVTGDLLRQDADALVNTVNTVGIMGKGIALQFKRAWPQMFEDYVAACERGEVQLGSMHVWTPDALPPPRYIINFPTKQHWRSRSRLSDIETGLQDLARTIADLNITSIALPPLGCGNGGLDWADVEPLIHSYLGPVAHKTDVRIFAPAGAPEPQKMVNREKPPPLNSTRSAMLALIHAYVQFTFGPPSLIEVQKLAYFLQLSGEDLNMEFRPHIYGPYADALRRALSAMEGHYITGFGDGSARVADAAPIEVLPEAVSQVESYIAEHPETAARIASVMDEIAGFESAYGLELLASVHWVMTHDAEARSSLEAAHTAVRRWSQRKSTLFTPSHVERAWRSLHERRLLQAI
ncbi:Appr-1-p processing domain protein [Kribbella flavida DSM 17836]|uniref:Appr-1-p processing domain protein n=1 Tax=Kribbella flavida (strain DSM 17836 / JCM 10339 / NBRC 14399) TaxID=479435 RepID=D2PRX3_KRIFD|nr:macro domain-containing protein [Kribbella flavida]ADB29303.1 Appr-1-p processing domain protein [Kribbella flavida DSM 17836]